MSALRPDPSYLPGLTKYVSFVDESGHAKDKNQSYLCLAGLLATQAAWKQLDVEWQTACAGQGLKAPFHMVDLASRRWEFAGWTEQKRMYLLNDLVSAISRAKAIPIGSVVSIEGFNTLPPRVRQGFKDPHFLAFQSLTYQIAVAASIQREPGPVTMVYAHHPKHSRGLANTGKLWEGVRKYTPIVASFMESYLCGQQADHIGLQAADLWAYELHRHFEAMPLGAFQK